MEGKNNVVACGWIARPVCATSPIGTPGWSLLEVNLHYSLGVKDNSPLAEYTADSSCFVQEGAIH